MGKLTTHVLDAAAGKPARGLRLSLYRRENGERIHICDTATNNDGRAPSPLMEGDGMAAGLYEIVFQAGEYLDAQGHDLPSPKFLDEVPIRFGIASVDENYHVPLLLSPFSFSTYRGS